MSGSTDKDSDPKIEPRSLGPGQIKGRLLATVQYITRRKWLIYLVVALLVAADVSYGIVHLDAKAPKTIPPFTPVVPRDETQLAHLGKKDYDAAHNSYTFYDYYLALPLQVSEQPLPAGYSSTAKTVKAAAAAFQADKSFNTSKDGLAYMTDQPAPAKQIVIFSESGLLIFLDTSFIQSTSFWNGYINTLGPVSLDKS